MDGQMKQAQRPGPARAAQRRAGTGAGGSAGGDAARGPVAQRANAGPHAASLAGLQAVVAQRTCADCEKVRRAMGGAAPAQRAKAGGLPGDLRAGLEQLSGRDLSGVTVNYGSPKPAQLNAHAFAQGSTIHLAPGQEKHLPHEGWHAVQQMEGRVRPTMSLGGTPVNDDAGLEREADVMGARALSLGGVAQRAAADGAEPPRSGGAARGEVVQRAVGFEFQTSWNIVPDPVGPVEGVVSGMGGMAARALGVEEADADALGFLAGRLTRGAVNLGSQLLGGVGRLGMQGLRWAGGGRAASALEGGVAEARRVAPQAIVKGVTLVSGAGWTMSNDGGEMEFATTHVADDDQEGMTAIMDDLSRFAHTLIAMRGEGLIPLVYFPGVTMLGTAAAVVPGEAAMPAVPQMTAGVDLTELGGLIRAMGQAGSAERQALTRDRGPLMGAVDANLPGTLAGYSSEFQGLVSLLAVHVAQSAILPQAGTEKDITPLMARTSLGVAFQRVPEVGVVPGPRLKTVLRQHVIAAANGAAATSMSGPLVPIDENMRLFPAKEMVDPTDNNLRSGPTVGEWLDGIVDGLDRTAATGIMDRLTARSMGAWGFMEMVGPGAGVPGLIMEFRNLPRDIAQAQWEAYALNLMRMINAVNA